MVISIYTKVSTMLYKLQEFQRDDIKVFVCYLSILSQWPPTLNPLSLMPLQYVTENLLFKCDYFLAKVFGAIGVLRDTVILDVCINSMILYFATITC